MAEKEKTCLSLQWNGVIDYGSRLRNGQGELLNDKWLTKNGNVEYTCGYISSRQLILENNSYNFTCEILCSNLNRPIFKIVLCNSNTDKTDNNNSNELAPKAIVEKSFLGLNPTETVKKLFCFLKIDAKGNYSGPFVFGFYYQDVISELAECPIEERIEIGNTGPSNGETYCNLSKQKRKNDWVGVVSYGTYNNRSNFLYKYGSKTLKLQVGFESLRQVKKSANSSVLVHCKILEKDDKPWFTCFTDSDPVKEASDKTAVKAYKSLMQELGVTGTKKWGGYEFFGLTKPEVVEVICVETCESSDDESCENAKKKVLLCDKPLSDLLNIRHRNAGPTCDLSSKRAQRERNEKIKELLEYASFGDLKSFLVHLCEEYPDVVDESILEVQEYVKHIAKTLKATKYETEIELTDAAELIIGKADLSQRGYKRLREILKNNNILLPGYEKVKSHCDEIDIGKISPTSCSQECHCMGVKTNLKETLQQVVSTNSIFELFKFFSTERQEKIFKYLKEKNEKLYQNLDVTKRTIVLRETGDNFRAACRFPTEQTSYSILNVTEMVNNPYGQYVSTLWRGSESREMLKTHVSAHYEELNEIVSNGINLVVGGAVEHFNVIVFFVADLCFVKDIIGHCQSTSTYGCFHCKMHKNNWMDFTQPKATSKVVQEMVENGKCAVETLGEDPDHSTKAFKDFQVTHYGQWTSFLFDAFITELMPPCGLHLILAHHRYLWKFLYDVINKRKQEHLIPKALRKVGCGYLAYQIEQYSKSKKKNYDGSETLKMIGNDCKLLESNADSFFDTFLKKDKGETWQSPSTGKIKQVLKVYNAFADIARDIRSLHPNPERIETFNTRVESYYKLFKTHSPTERIEVLPYFHYLRNHVGNLMKFYHEYFGYGYGFFCCHAGEHLNKLIKTSEIHDTNLGKNRFKEVVQRLRMKQLIYTKTVIKQFTTVKCTACKEVGHNRKNKSCRLHPSHPRIVASDSEGEEEKEKDEEQQMKKKKSKLKAKTQSKKKNNHIK